MKKSKLFPQMNFLVEKVKRLCASGRPSSLTLEINGKRINGKEVKELTFEENQITFEFEKVKCTIPFCDLLDVKRLRTRKYLFFVESKNEVKFISENAEELTEKKVKGE